MAAVVAAAVVVVCAHEARNVFVLVGVVVLLKLFFDRLCPFPLLPLFVAVAVAVMVAVCRAMLAPLFVAFVVLRFGPLRVAVVAAVPVVVFVVTAVAAVVVLVAEVVVAIVVEVVGVAVFAPVALNAVTLMRCNSVFGRLGLHTKHNKKNMHHNNECEKKKGQAKAMEKKQADRGDELRNECRAR